MQTSNAAASNVIFKQKIRGNVAVAQKTIKEGSIFTDISAKGFTTTEGHKQLCVSVRESDPDESDTVFEGCGPAQQLTIANGLGSATVWRYSHRFRFYYGRRKDCDSKRKVDCNRKSADLYVQYPN